jgi:hypothetical protein
MVPSRVSEAIALADYFTNLPNFALSTQLVAELCDDVIKRPASCPTANNMPIMVLYQRPVFNNIVYPRVRKGETSTTEPICHFVSPPPNKKKFF